MPRMSSQERRRHCGKLGLKRGKAERPGHSASDGVPSFWKIWKIVSISLSPWKSGAPLVISPKMQPTLQMSTGRAYSSQPNKISGARYHVVTTSWVSCGIGTQNARAMPKSAIFRRPSPVNVASSTRRFWGFRSRWMIRLLWQKSIPSSNWRINDFTAALSIFMWGKRFMCCLRCMGTNSKMRYKVPGQQHTSSNCTIFGCLVALRTATSRIAVHGTPSSEFVDFTLFAATVRPDALQNAL
mmetsp:Transcript_7260/g.20645  ORF Transcript_7260/g.20645 Transcript_7260/m.20645 type:complete len:241 (+) Transcript_7260:438-1160(+)